MSQLLDQMRDRIRTLHYSIRTEDSYVLWAKQFILFHRKRHPLEMGEAEVGEFLTYLAVERNVAASTENQALSAILFLYKVVLDRPLERVEDVLRAKKPQRLPVVFTREEVRAVLARMQGDKAVMASLLPLWVGVAPDGVLAVARQGSRLRAEPHRRARRQGAEVSSDRSAWLTRRCASKGRSSGWMGWKQGRN